MKIKITREIELENLSKNDTEILLSFGHRVEDLAQIDKAISVSRYYVYNSDNNKGSDITAKTARRLLGAKEFLSGIGRSAFHWNAIRETKDGREVLFDSSPLFK